MTNRVAKDGIPIFEDWHDVPDGIVTEQTIRDMMLDYDKNEKPFAYFQEKFHFGYRLLFDRRKHPRFHLPKYTVEYVQSEDYLLHLFTFTQCKSFNCDVEEDEFPVAYLTHQLVDGIIKYFPLYDRKAVLDELTIYEKKDDLPMYFLSKENCRKEGFPVKKDEKPSGAMLVRDKLFPYYDRKKQVRLRKLFNK